MVELIKLPIYKNPLVRPPGAPDVFPHVCGQGGAPGTWRFDQEFG